MKSRASNASLAALTTADARRAETPGRRPGKCDRSGCSKRGNGKSAADELACMLSGARASCPFMPPCVVGDPRTASPSLTCRQPRRSASSELRASDEPDPGPPKSAPSSPKIAQDGSRMAPGLPGWPREDPRWPKMAPSRPGLAIGYAYEAPRWPQGFQGGARAAPGWPQEGPRMTPG